MRRSHTSPHDDDERSGGAAREFYQAVLDAVRQPLLEVDADLRVVAANRAFLEAFALEPRALIGRRLDEVMAARWDLPALRALVSDVVSGHRQLGDYELGPAPDGEGTVHFHARRLADTSHVLLAIEPDHDVDGQSGGVGAVFTPGDHEATGIDDFLSILGHELRSPLSAIHNVSQLLVSRRTRDPVRVAELHRVLERQTALMVRLVDDLMDFSRVNTGVLSLHRENISLRECVVSAVNSIELKADRAALDLSVDLPAEDLRIHADPLRITQVISNLLDNAVKYNVSGGCVWLTVCVEDGNAVISVRDNGVGIAPADLESVFDVFTRLGDPGRGREGLGLGLALVRQFVALHDGDVEARSDGQGEGAEFRVRLPLSKTPARGPDTPSAGSGREGLRLLLVDDNADSVDTLAGLLEEAGHEVRVAYGGGEALKLVVGFRPDVIFLDIGMPDMNGYEVARRLQDDGLLRGARLVALTGYGQARDVEEIEAAGFDQHLLKPVRLHDLEVALQGG